MKFNIKKIVLVLSVVMVISFAIAGGIASSNLRQTKGGNLKGLWNFNIGLNAGNLEKYNINEEKQHSIDGLNSIQISSSSNGINFHKAEGNEIRVHFHGTIETNTDHLPWLETDLNNGRLSIEIKRNSQTVMFGTVINNHKLLLDIYLPEVYLKELDIKSSSGSVNISEIKAEQLSIKVSSGSINANDIEAEIADFVSSSGSINLTNFTGELEAQTSSGAIRVDTAETTRTNVRASSGAIALTNFSGDLQGQTSSGSIMVEYSKYNNNIDLKGSSGAIALKLPEEANFDLYAKTSSGRVESKFPILMTNSTNNRLIEGTVGNGGNQINLQTSSGGIKLHF